MSTQLAPSHHVTLSPRAVALVILTASSALLACAAGDSRFAGEAPAGFWFGLWHGVISWVTLVIGIFNDTVKVYEVHNTGGWYDFGFLFGVVAIWGGSSRAYRRDRRAVARRERQEWTEIAEKVERKLERKIRQWAEAEPDEDWDAVERRAAEKLKARIRQWAEEGAEPGGQR